MLYWVIYYFIIENNIILFGAGVGTKTFSPFSSFSRFRIFFSFAFSFSPFSSTFVISRFRFLTRKRRKRFLFSFFRRADFLVFVVFFLRFLKKTFSRFSYKIQHNLFNERKTYFRSILSPCLENGFTAA